MRTYGQYCPIARGAEIFAERWTPLIIRNLHLGCETFGEILDGAPGLSRQLLTERLKQLERFGIVESAPKAHGRGHRYRLTTSGHDLFRVCQALGEWGARWLEIAPENLDPFVALWSMCNALRRDRIPDRRVVIRVDFAGFRPHERYWLLLEHGEVELCKTYSGLDEDLYVTADAEAFVKWHAGQLSWAEATCDSRIRLDGPSWLVRAFPTWNGRSMFAHITRRAASEKARGRPDRPPSHAEHDARRWLERPAIEGEGPAMDGVRTRLSGPVIGCPDAWELADFYASLLGWKVSDRSEAAPGEWALMRSPAGDQKLEFQREVPFVPPVWPTVAGEQQMGMHLDIGVDGLAPVSEMEQRRRQFFEVAERARSLGARTAQHQPQPERVLVMLDPAGHPFCLFPGA